MRRFIRAVYNKWINWRYRLRLQNDNFTIITNSCIGGVMYHKLGKQFLSPTINLWLTDEDFYKFVQNLDFYLAQPLCFTHTHTHTHTHTQGAPYPIATCGDIQIHFNHYKSNEEAAEKWYERCKRINRDNLFIICSDRPCTRTITYEDIASLKNIKCKGKVVFSTHQYDDIDYIVPYPADPEGDFVKIYMLDKTSFLQRWRWESAWDWVHWLNTGEVKV